MSDFKVGDFKSSGNAEARKTREAKPKAAPEATAPAEADVKKTQVEIYKERLESAGITASEANAIFDDVINKGYYQETASIRGRKAIFRTRSYEDHVRSLGAVEVQSPRFQATQEELQARHNLAASLVEWNGTLFKKGGASDVEFAEAMQAIRKMASPVYSLLLAALVRFDAKVYVVFSDGAAESF